MRAMVGTGKGGAPSISISDNLSPVIGLSRSCSGMRTEENERPMAVLLCVGGTLVIQINQ